VHAAMATDRAKRTQSAGELRAALERFGAVGLRSMVRNSPLPLRPPSMVPARSVSPGRPLSTSAAGISLRPAALSKAPLPVGVIVGALGLTLAAAVAGGLWWSHVRALTLEVASAAPPLVSPGAVAVPPSSVAAEVPAAPAITVTASPSVAPALVDSALGSAAAPRPVQSALGSAAPRVAAPHPAAGRADQRGLAKDNPFK